MIEAVVVRRCWERSDAELCALVLSARGIESAIIRDDYGFSVLVADEDQKRAREELDAHDLENRQQPAPVRTVSSAPPSIEFVLIYWAILLFFFAAVRRGALSVEWLEIGAADARLIRAGELWRTVTALFLHVDGMHLLSNLAFGTVFLLLLSQVTGAGVAALAVVAAGAVGNAMNALVQPGEHSSIGASTAVFAAIGLIAAMRQNRRTSRKSSRLRDWAPLAGGVMLLALLGFGEGQTDILAHVFGFAAGVCAGLLPLWRDRDWAADRRAQPVAGWLASGFVALAWLCAILAAG